jgi:hypothetical protein
MESKTVIVADYYEIEELAHKHLGLEPDVQKWDAEKAKFIRPLRPYSFVATQECGNDTCHEFIVCRPEDDSYNDSEEYDNVRAGDVEVLNNDVVLNLLCEGGFLEPGEYIVRVSW